MNAGSTLTAASRQWASRPADERYLDLPSMLKAAEESRSHSSARVVSSRQLTAIPAAQAGIEDSQGLMIVGPGGNPVAPTHWAFGQLCQRAQAPAGYLRELPAELAADNLNFGLQVRRGPEDVGVLLYRNGGTPELRAATGPNYGRVWNHDVIRALVHKFGDGVTGDFRVPGIFGEKLQTITTDNTTLWFSKGDRNMFVFLADEEHRITVPNRRNGAPGSLARGFFVWNSEVGDTTLGIGLFLFDYVCCNRIVWGAEGYKEIRIRHTASAPDRFVEEVKPALVAYSNSSAEPVQHAIQAAQQAKLGSPDKVQEFLLNRFTKGQTAAIMATHISEEQRPIETLWDASTAVTAYARAVEHQDARVQLEREAGKILNLAA